MAKAARLKVYVTPIGFHDAFVAVPSQKAALAAWGTATNLFGAGRAALVEDGPGYDEALATPGTVIRRLRGTEAAMLDFPAPAPTRAPDRSPVKKGTASRSAAEPIRQAKPPRRAEPPKPEPPDRTRLYAAETALDEAQRDLAEELDRIAAERRALDAREKAVRAAAARPLRELGAARDAARRAYEAADAAFRRRR